MAVMNKDSMYFTHIYIGNKACKIIPPFLSRKNLLEDSKTLFFGLVKCYLHILLTQIMSSSLFPIIVPV